MWFEVCTKCAGAVHPANKMLAINKKYKVNVNLPILFHLVPDRPLQPTPQGRVCVDGRRDGKSTRWYPRRAHIYLWMACQPAAIIYDAINIYTIDVIISLPQGPENNRVSIRVPGWRIITRDIAGYPPEISPINV